MRTNIKAALLFAVLAFAQTACEKDEVMTIATKGEAPALTVSTSDLVLTNENAAKEAIQFSWSPVNYGYQAVVNYTIQLDKKGNNFAKPAEIAAGASLKKALTTSDINALMINKLKLNAGQLTEVEARVVSTLGAQAKEMDLISAVKPMKITPYFVVIVYPSIYVPGSHQGWAPDKAPKLVSIKDDKTYEGYVYFPDASNEFKFTNEPNWTGGDYGSAGVGKLGKGDNLKIVGAGFYLLKANLNTLTWSSLKTEWGVIGSATKGGWDADENMTYDPKDGLWKADLVLKAGEIKFRANDDWALAYGDGNGDGMPDTLDNNNIKIEAAGTYTITLNLSNAGNFTYTLTKK